MDTAEPVELLDLGEDTRREKITAAVIAVQQQQNPGLTVDVVSLRRRDDGTYVVETVIARGVPGKETRTKGYICLE